MSEQTKSNMFQLTINNPQLEDFNIRTGNTIHERIKNILTQLCSMYFCYCCETGEKGTQHIHIYTVFYKPMTDGFSKLKRLFPTSHIEICRGDINSNYNYIMKHAKNKISDSHLNLVNGDFYEHGIRPAQNYTYNYGRYNNDLLDKINMIEIKLDELIKIISAGNGEVTENQGVTDL